MADRDYIQQQYDKVTGLMKAHGIISIIFGALGALFSLFLMLLFAFAITDYNEYQIGGAVFMAVLVFIFGVVPSAYLTIAGIILVGKPKPSVAKGLVITNLVVGVFYNLVVLILAIINLVQIGDYERGYKK